MANEIIQRQDNSTNNLQLVTNGSEGQFLSIVNGEPTWDTFIPKTYTSDRSLLRGTDRIVQSDCTAATRLNTLPDATTNIGAKFFLKNTGLSATNVVKLIPLGSDTIEGVPAARPCILANGTEYVGVYSDGTTVWQKFVQRTFTFASIQASASTPTIGTSFANFDAWSINAHSTPEKCEVNLTNNVIDILDFQGPFQDGYVVTVIMSFEYTNNKVISAQLYANGALVGLPVSVNALGAGKPTSISISDSIGISSATTLELHMKAESGGAGTLTLTEAKMICERIGG